jgi:flagellar hook-associated protein 1 FlgK
MSLSGALQIGSSALNAAQLAIQITGNNLANAATAGYSRQIAILNPTRSQNLGTVSIGTGVAVTDVQRQIDQALQDRLYSGISQEAAAGQDNTILSQIQDTLGELGDNSLTKQLSSFFKSWSDRANGNSSNAVVISQGQTLADFVRKLHSDLNSQRDQIDQDLGTQVQAADGLLTQIASINQSISTTEASGGGQANTLRDQRDSLISQLSQYMDVSTVEQPNGTINVLVGSTPVVLGATSRGLQLTRRSVNGEIEATVGVKQDGQQLTIRSGQIGSLLANRDSTVTDVVNKLDKLTSQLIFEVNKLHSTGTTASGLTTTTGTLGMAIPDQTRALDDPANGTMAALPFHPTSGGFSIRVAGPGGATQTVRINIDLDGRDNTGAPGYGNDTSLDDIRASLSAIPGISASITPDGQLKIDAQPGYSYSFSDDTSGVLATLGVNSYFTGTSGADIGVNQALKDDPTLLATGSYDGDTFVDNGTAMQINSLQDQSLTALGGVSINKNWQDTVQQLGVSTQAAQAQSAAATTVRQSLEAQRASISGVSVDEESVNLLTYQRQYQGAARYITTVDQMMQTLLAIT